MALTRSELTTPLAVLVGACLIAGVLWHGFDRVAQALKAQPVSGVRVASAIAAAPAATGASSPAGTGVPAAGAQESAAARHNRITEQVELALARQRPDYVRMCWKPQPPAPGEAPDFGGAFEIEIKFDANGGETSRTVLSGAYARPPLLACVRAARLPPLEIPAPGGPVTVIAHMPVP